MTKQAKLFTYALTAFFIALFAILSIITGGGAQFASAAASAYSDALSDLRTDAMFAVDGFPVVAGDYSLTVIQVAESTDGELLIYVYQPAGDKAIKASSINIARQDNDAAKFQNYELTFLNSNGVFYKYKVDGFELEVKAIRFYNISNILRPYDRVIDEPPAAGQTVSEVPNAVGQLWTVCTVGDSVTYTMTESEVIEVTEKYVGFVNYDEGHNFGFTTTTGATSAHFVAFDTDKPIERLISADVSFNERAVTYQLCANVAHQGQGGHSYKDKFNYNYGDKQKHNPDPVTITYKDKVFDVGKNNYTWDRIRSTAEFLADENNSDYRLTNEGATGIDGTKWVLNFYETPIEAKTNGSEWLPLLNGFAALFNGVGDYDCRYTEVSDVIILRLEFETDGVHYNLGVVDNKQTGSNKPVNTPVGSGCTADFGWLSALPVWSWFLIVPGAIIVVILLAWLIAWLVTLPFRKLSERRAQAAATSTKRKKRKPRKGGKK